MNEMVIIFWPKLQSSKDSVKQEARRRISNLLKLHARESDTQAMSKWLAFVKKMQNPSYENLVDFLNRDNGFLVKNGIGYEDHLNLSEPEYLEYLDFMKNRYN